MFIVIGGWLALVCPCGVVYAMDVILRSESVRDYVDILLSFKHPPNIFIYDYAPMLAKHANLRTPEAPLFQPFEGRLAECSTQNINDAKKSALQVNLPWIVHRKCPPDTDGHPVTGCNERFCLYDTFHQKNCTVDKELLRQTKICPQLSGRVNTQIVEQLNRQMGRNNYFLNMMKPGNQLFTLRLIFHLNNLKRNKLFRAKLNNMYRTVNFNVNANGQLRADNADDILDDNSVHFISDDECEYDDETVNVNMEDETDKAEVEIEIVNTDDDVHLSQSTSCMHTIVHNSEEMFPASVLSECEREYAQTETVNADNDVSLSNLFPITPITMPQNSGHEGHIHESIVLLHTVSCEQTGTTVSIETSDAPQVYNVDGADLHNEECQHFDMNANETLQPAHQLNNALPRSTLLDDNLCQPHYIDPLLMRKVIINYGTILISIYY
jgi:hypothetical protein